MLKLFNKVPDKKFCLQMAEWLSVKGEESAAKKVVFEVLKEDPSNKAARALYAEIVSKINGMSLKKDESKSVETNFSSVFPKM
jgi:hypothetical protein